MERIKHLKTLHKSGQMNSIAMALFAAILYGMSAPASKWLLTELSPTFMAALLYLGAGFGMLFVYLVNQLIHPSTTEAKITAREWPYVLAMILLDIVAPILLMIGLKNTTASNASLLNNFEIVATSLIALFIFKEAIGKRMWWSIMFITLASIVLSFSGLESLKFSVGSIFILFACLAWGFENNCTRMLSLKNPLQIVIIKGLGSGVGALMIAISLGQVEWNLFFILLTLMLGFVAYGLSIFFYIRAQRTLGAARTSAYYAAAPFIGVLISWFVLKESLSINFVIALGIMAVGSYLAVTENHHHHHFHERVVHEHKHRHDDGHHLHHHVDLTSIEMEEHTHLHEHESMEHQHGHMPDLHHRHLHE